ncbi:hypothetical protein RUM44_005424 [Polyplax serrata]|uniref:Uncharacterized protein n=1 Tax=Polyplax serrata TaxID=468196 RepID=A0ABR1AW19_POLSC
MSGWSQNINKLEPKKNQIGKTRQGDTFEGIQMWSEAPGGDYFRTSFVPTPVYPSLRCLYSPRECPCCDGKRGAADDQFVKNSDKLPKLKRREINFSFKYYAK